MYTMTPSFAVLNLLDIGVNTNPSLVHPSYLTLTSIPRIILYLGEHNNPYQPCKCTGVRTGDPCPCTYIQ